MSSHVWYLKQWISGCISAKCQPPPLPAARHCVRGVPDYISPYILYIHYTFPEYTIHHTFPVYTVHYICTLYCPWLCEGGARLYPTLLCTRPVYSHYTLYIPTIHYTFPVYTIHYVLTVCHPTLRWACSNMCRAYMLNKALLSASSVSACSRVGGCQRGEGEGIIC